MACVGSADAEDSVCLARDRVRLSDLWNGAHHFPHPIWWHPSLAVDLDKGLDRPAQSGGLHFGGKTPNHTAMSRKGRACKTRSYIRSGALTPSSSRVDAITCFASLAA